MYGNSYRYCGLSKEVLYDPLSQWVYTIQQIKVEISVSTLTCHIFKPLEVQGHAVPHLKALSSGKRLVKRVK